eukprot:3173799-Pleurochrysis_carterae.AAC.1
MHLTARAAGASVVQSSACGGCGGGATAMRLGLVAVKPDHVDLAALLTHCSTTPPPCARRGPYPRNVL